MGVDMNTKTPTFLKTKQSHFWGKATIIAWSYRHQRQGQTSSTPQSRQSTSKLFSTRFFSTIHFIIKNINTSFDGLFQRDINAYIPLSILALCKSAASSPSWVSPQGCYITNWPLSTMRNVSVILFRGVYFFPGGTREGEKSILKQ